MPEGEDPRNDCAGSDTSTCGDNGACDGDGACAKHPAGTQCQPAACAEGILTPAHTCDGAGTCVAPEDTASCEPYTCNVTGTECRIACTGDEQCAEGQVCQNGSCGKKPAGSPCQVDDECFSGFCSPAPDNVCCNRACDGTCESCKEAGSVGTCKFVSSGRPAETGECPAEPTTSCGRSGLCDGSGGCAKYGTDVTCSVGLCSGATLDPAGTCNGSGLCVEPAEVPCNPFVCSASGGSCLATCAADADCVAGYFCNTGSGQCELKKAKGTACSGANQCATGFCADGVCCDLACTEGCKVCNRTGLVGTCSNVANGEDPRNACTQTSQSSCGTDGACNGSGACRLWASDTVCEAASCSSASFTPASTCDGAGTCVDASTNINCYPYKCNSGGCLTSCSSLSDCADGVVACSSNTCGKKPLGATCSGNADCNSNFCVDGVCCENACTGTCKTCSLSTALGSCRDVPTGQDPRNHCGVDACHDGTCDGGGACTVSTGSVCGTPTCDTDGVSVRTPVCASNGSCSSSTDTACNGYACGSGGSCKTSCASDSDCDTATHFCQSATSTCQPKQGAGTACSRTQECSSGACTDGICCNVTCDGPCQFCATGGTCTPRNLGTDIENGCTGGLACNGAGACNGTCGADTDCESGYFCSAGSCVAKKNLGESCTAGNQCSNGNCVNNTCCGSASCASDQTCANPAGQCKKKLGETCTGASECTYSSGSNGFCVDGVCCNNSCAGECRACNVTGFKGSCTTFSAGTDPLNECTEGLACTVASEVTRCAIEPCSTNQHCEPGYICDSGTGKCISQPGWIAPGTLFPMQMTCGLELPAGQNISITIGDPSPICARMSTSDPSCAGANHQVDLGFMSTSVAP